MRLQRYMINELSLPSWITNMFNKIKKEMVGFSFSEIERKSEQAFDDILNVLDKDDLAKVLKKLGINPNIIMKNESVIDESAKHWWDLIKTEAFPTLAFYPALQVWLELDKMLKGTEYSGKVIGFYAAFWLILVSAKYVKGHFDWRKEKPQEFAKEKEMGVGGLI